MTREVKNGKVAFKGGQCGRMDHHVWQVVPGTNNSLEKKCLVASMVQWYIWWNNVTESMVTIRYDRHVVGIIWNNALINYRVIQIKLNQFKKRAILWSLTCQYLSAITVTNISSSFTYNMAQISTVTVTASLQYFPPMFNRTLSTVMRDLSGCSTYVTVPHYFAFPARMKSIAVTVRVWKV